MNQGPADLQSAALTTELCTHVIHVICLCCTFSESHISAAPSTCNFQCTMYSSNDKHLCSTIYLQNANGLLRELNPGPLAPEARIMPLDQAANVNYASIVCQLSSMHQLETKVTLQSLLLESTFQRNSGCALSAYRLVPPAQDPFSIGGMSLP